MQTFPLRRNRARRIRSALLLLVCALTLAACNDLHDDYNTTVSVVIDMPEGYAAGQMQGTITLTNLNNRQTYSSSSFSGTTVSIEVLRGVYAAEAEGSLRYTDAAGETHTGNFRASTSYCEVLSHPSEVHLSLILI